MTFLFFDDKLGGRLSPKKGEALKARIDFDELFVKIVDKKAHLFFWATAHTAYALEDKEKKKKWEGPNKIYACIDGAEGSDGEKVLFAILSTLEAEKCYAGYVNIDGNVMNAEKYLSNPAKLELVADMFFAGLPVEPVNLKLDECIPQAAKGKGGYAKGETKSEQITARRTALSALMADTIAVADLQDSIMAITGEPATPERMMQLLLTLLS